MSAEATIGTPQRQRVVSDAAEKGFTYRDLTDAHLAIALITGRAYARHIVNDAVENAEGMSEIAVAALAYSGDAPSEPLARGLTGLPMLGDLGGFDAIEEIASLLSFFARTTCSHPDGTDEHSWRNLITDISVELQLGLVRGDIPMLERNMARLVEHFGHLWS
jgi:hypothetical protein|tara:strand:- start:653 stop:1141 length:489 start_codon:yes stop_codon:yes gene_type:complete